MLRLIERWWQTTTKEERSGLAPPMLTMLDCAESEGWTWEDRASLILAELWALEANAPYGQLKDGDSELVHTC